MKMYNGGHTRFFNVFKSRDDDGNVITETLFITDTFRCISEERDIKINKILDK